MNNLSLKQVLSLKNVQKGIQSNLFTSQQEVAKAINKTLEVEKDNVLSIETDRNGEIVDFENTLHKDEDKQLYLLESRVFSKGGAMINAYLEVLDTNGQLCNEYIDDVWEYADWQVIK